MHAMAGKMAEIMSIPETIEVAKKNDFDDFNDRNDCEQSVEDIWN